MKLWTTSVGAGEKRAALIHGITGDGGTWFELAPWVVDHGYTVTLVDLRGHGRSPRAGSYAMTEFADDLVETLPIGLDLVVGHSLGGRVLAHAVDRLRPARAVYLDPAWVVTGGGNVPRPVHDDGSLMTVDEVAPLLPHRSRAHLEQAIASNGRFDPAVLDPPHFPPASYEPGPPLVPSLVVVADPSALVPPELQDRLRRDGYEVRVVPGGQHDLHVDNLAATTSAVEDWL